MPNDLWRISSFSLVLSDEELSLLLSIKSESNDQHMLFHEKMTRCEVFNMQHDFGVITEKSTRKAVVREEHPIVVCGFLSFLPQTKKRVMLHEHHPFF